jgi:hypothetical protein
MKKDWKDILYKRKNGSERRRDWEQFCWVPLMNHISSDGASVLISPTMQFV